MFGGLGVDFGGLGIGRGQGGGASLPAGADLLGSSALAAFTTSGPKFIFDAGGNFTWSPHNYLPDSEDFTAWTASNLTGTTAHTLTDANASAVSFASESFTAIIGRYYTLTAWFLKDAVTSRFPGIEINGGTAFQITHLNTQTGAIANKAGSTGTSAVVDGGTYWILSATIPANLTTVTCFLYPAVATVIGTSNVAALGSATIDKVMVNLGIATGPYVKTVGGARFGVALNYVPTTHVLRGIWAERQAIQLAQQSQTLGTTWVVGSLASRTADVRVAPDGTTTTDRLTEDTTSGTHGIYQAVTIVSGADYAASAFFFAGTSSFAAIGFSSASVGDKYVMAVVDLSLIAIGQTKVGNTSGALKDARITNCGGGYFYAELIGNLALTDGEMHLYLAPAGSGVTFSAGGAPTYLATSRTLDAWGYQFEAGSWPTSYIPRAAAAVTRLADTVNAPIAFDATTATLVIKGHTPRATGASVLCQLDDGTEGNRIRIERDASNHVLCSITAGSVQQCSIDLGVVANDSSFAVGLGWVAGAASASLRGDAVVTGAPTSIPTVTTLRVGCSFTGEAWGDHVETIRQHAGKLTDALLMGVTAQLGPFDDAVLVTFAFGTDIHAGGTPDVGQSFYSDAVAKMDAAVAVWNAAAPSFAMFGGDLIDDTAGSGAAMLSALATIEAEYDNVICPRYYVFGNHDFYYITKAQFIANTVMPAKYYSFDVNKVRFIVLDACNLADNDASDYGLANYIVSGDSAYVGPAQRTWLAATLAAAPGPCVVFCHHRLDNSASDFLHVTNAAAVRTVLEAAGKVLVVICGHLHANAHNTVNGIEYITMDAMLDGDYPVDAFAVVDVRRHRIVVHGYGTQTSYDLAV